MPGAPDVLVDPAVLRDQVRAKYREVAAEPGRRYHFHTGRPLAARLGYDAEVVAALPDRAVESFAGVANPFSLRRIQPGERVVDVGSGAGFDSVVAAGRVGPEGRVVEGEGNARAFEVNGYAFLARKPAEPPAARSGDDT